MSSSVRTCETWAGISRTPLEVIPKLRVLPELYQAGPDRMLAVLGTAHADTVMLLGHNPGIAELAAMLCSQVPQTPAFRKFPTAATLVMDFQVEDWAQVRPGMGSVLDFFTPSSGD